MKLAKTIAAILCLSSASIAQVPSRSYSFLFKENERTWCGYSDEHTFQELAGEVKPLESARVLYKSGKLSEIVYQVQAESGDWVVIDTYNFKKPRAMTLRRATVFAQSGIQIVQKGDISKGRKNHLLLVSAQNSDGTKASVEGVDYPDVAIKNNLSQFPFLTIAESMQKKSLQTLCGRPYRR